MSNLSKFTLHKEQPEIIFKMAQDSAMSIITKIVQDIYSVPSTRKYRGHVLYISPETKFAEFLVENNIGKKRYNSDGDFLVLEIQICDIIPEDHLSKQSKYWLDSRSIWYWVFQ